MEWCTYKYTDDLKEVLTLMEESQQLTHKQFGTITLYFPAPEGLKVMNSVAFSNSQSDGKDCIH
jgi:hypothetical protein